MSWIEIKRINEERSALNEKQRKMVEETKGVFDEARQAEFDKIGQEERAKAKQVENIKITLEAERSVNDMIGRDSEGFRVETDKEVLNRAKRKNLFGRSLTPEESRTLLAAGGALVPETLSTEFIRVGQSFRGVIAAGARHVNTPTAGPHLIPKLNDTSNTGEMLAAENTAFADVDRTETQVSLPVYKFSSKSIRLSLNYMRDSQINDLEGEVAAMAAERIFKAFNTYATTGTGTSQPQGCVVGASAGKTFASPTAFTYAEVLDLIHSLGEHYREGAKLMFTDTTLLALRKIVASDNVPLWGPGNIAAGIPETLGGCQFIVNSAMASPAASAKSLLYGNFAKGYAYRTVGNEPEGYVLPITTAFEGGWVFGFDMGGVVTDSTAIKYGVHPAS